jgi:hypothetical protein
MKKILSSIYEALLDIIITISIIILIIIASSLFVTWCIVYVFSIMIISIIEVITSKIKKLK